MVSIIVPVYKSEKTLERCVSSVLKQDYEEFELILVVDGPPDNSGVLAKELAAKDARIRVLNQANQGVSKARNHGIREARGEYIRFLDSDDYLPPNALGPMVDKLIKDGSDIVIAGYDHLYFGAVIPKIPAEEGCYFVKDSSKIMKSLYESGFLNMPWNKLFRKEMIEKEFPTDRELGEDLLFNLAYLKKCKKMSILSESVCEYIQDDRGTTLSTKKRDNKIETALYLYEATKDFFESVYDNPKDLSFLTTKVMTTFLDEIELVGFAKASYNEKYQMVKRFADAAVDFYEKEAKGKIYLKKTDYKIVSFFVMRKQIKRTLLLVKVRALIVNIVRKGRVR